MPGPRVYSLDEVTKGYTYECGMKVYCERGERLDHVASGRIVHGYAKINNRQDWSLVRLGDDVIARLEGLSR